MKASDVRLGNLLLNPYSNEPEEAHSIRPVEALNATHEINEEHPNFFKGIPLTEEWLERFGFKRGGYEGLTVAKGDFELHGDCPADYPTGREYPPIGIRVNDRLDVYVEYVHQLQNLFFALTGEELTIKEK